MLDLGYLFARDDKRLFVNTSLGCKSRCTYCYLSKLGYYYSKEKVKSAEEILELLESSGYRYDKDTVITFGCFSECFDDVNKLETVKLVEYFLSKGNQVQVSTKKQIDEDTLTRLASKQEFYGQLVLFVSSATISRHDKLEIDTDSPEMRFMNFNYGREIPVVLYIKPVLKDITILDIEEYLEYIKLYGIKDVVVGSMFSEIKSEETVPFSNSNKLFYKGVSDEEVLIQEFSKYARVFKRSTQVLKIYK